MISLREEGIAKFERSADSDAEECTCSRMACADHDIDIKLLGVLPAGCDASAGQADAWKGKRPGTGIR